MSVIHAYSSVAIQDSLDVGNLQSYLSSNQPTSVIYNPNNSAYTPDWSSSHLIITPVITFNGASLSLSASGLTISYTRRDGSGTAVALTTGETANNGVLEVSANKLADSQSKIITYICDIAYADPSTGVTVRTQNTLTYSLITSGSDIKYAYITGESTFLYDSTRDIVGSDSIVLTADVSNVSISQWQYLNSSGQYVAFPTGNNQSISGTTLTVMATENSIWLNNRTATIKLATSDPDVYDIHQIIKIYDGTAGDSTVSVVLSNQSHYVPCDDEGNVITFNGASTDIHIYEGGEDVSFDAFTLLDENNTILTDENNIYVQDYRWKIVATLGPGLEGTFVDRVFTPTALTQETSYVDFICTCEGYSELYARYTITKSRSGSDGQDAVIYEVAPDTYVVNLSEDNVYTPTSVTFSAYTKTGSSLTKNAYSGRFIIAETEDGVTYVDKYTSANDEAIVHYSPSTTSVLNIRCRLYVSGNTTTILDEQLVVITRDGISGEDGQDGIPGYTVGLVNHQDILPCTPDGKVSGEQNLTIPFYAFAGINKIPVTASITSSLPSGITLATNTAGTASSNGNLVLRAANGATLGGTSVKQASITIRLTATRTDGGTFTTDSTYVLTKNLKGSDGETTSILQIYSEDGGIIRNSEGNTTLKLRYVFGANAVTPTSITWYKFTNGSYSPISGATSSSLVVTASMVDDFEFFKATAAYGGTTCEAFYTVDDIQDPYTAQTVATVREFKNGQGCGAIYTRVYRGAEEVDPLKSLVFSTVAPSPASSGDYYYELNASNKTCTLKQYNGTSWVTASENYIYTYKYYRINATGQSVDTSTPYKTQRCIYVDPSIIGNSMQFVCEIN